MPDRPRRSQWPVSTLRSSMDISCYSKRHAQHLILIAVDPRLPRCPLSVKLMNGSRVDVGSRGNGPDAAVPHIGEQEGFAADENIETGPSRTGACEGVEEHPRV